MTYIVPQSNWWAIQLYPIVNSCSSCLSLFWPFSADRLAGRLSGALLHRLSLYILQIYYTCVITSSRKSVESSQNALCRNCVLPPKKGTLTNVGQNEQCFANMNLFRSTSDQEHLTTFLRWAILHLQTTILFFCKKKWRGPFSECPCNTSYVP